MPTRGGTCERLSSPVRPSTLRAIARNCAQTHAWGPPFETNGGSGVRVVLPFRGKTSATLSAREQAGLEGFKVGQPFSSAEYAKRAKVSLRTAATDLASLAERGLVVRSGVGRATRWSRT